MASKDEVLAAMARAIDAASRSATTAEGFAIAALRAADALGWRMAPKEASEEMLQAFVDGERFEQKPRPREIWEDMLSASPSLIEEQGLRLLARINHSATNIDHPFKG